MDSSPIMKLIDVCVSVGTAEDFGPIDEKITTDSQETAQLEQRRTLAGETNLRDR